MKEFKKIREFAKVLEKDWGVNLEPYSIDEEGYLGYEDQEGDELVGVAFEIIDSRIERNEDYPLVLSLDSKGGFQFWAESSPVGTFSHSPEQRQHMATTLIAEPMSIAFLNKKIYEDVFQNYVKNS